MEARNRNLQAWYSKIKSGELKLPRFQRFESWDRRRISSLIQTVTHNLPLGITLVLEVGDQEKFISRNLKTAPLDGQRVNEHLLDGQQRLTALWRAFHNNYETETYFIYIKNFDNYEYDEERENMVVFSHGRYFKKNGEKYPLWCDTPALCLERGFIPTHLLKPEDNQNEIDDWIKKAIQGMEPEGGKEELKAFYNFEKKVSDKIKDLRSIVANYNLPYLSLPSQTDKSVALEVFINMNTNSKPLSTYDIIVAEIESLMGKSLHDLLDALEEKDPNLTKYSDLSDMMLNTSALLQEKLPNQRGAWDMDKRLMVSNWKKMERGMRRMAEFIKNEGIYDKQRLPTNAVLAVIAALYSYIPDFGDKLGKDELLLKKYLWRAFFTDRYENSAATHAFADFVAIRKVIQSEIQEEAIPIFKEHSLIELEELLTTEWPKRATIHGRAILSVMCRLGSFDFSTGVRLNPDNIENRHYHHIFPDALLKEADINSFLALNCTLISDKTNVSIGSKEPLSYMKDRYKWTTEEIVCERLQSHLIPIPELENGGYDGLSEGDKKEKLKSDFTAFIQRRGELLIKAIHLLTQGRQLSIAELYHN